MRTRPARGESLALLGGAPVGEVRAPQWPRFTMRQIERVAQLLHTGETVVIGRRGVVEEAERAIAAYHPGKRVLLLNSGFSALHAALMGLEIGPGDEVITTPYTFGATTSCILFAGAVPVYVDVDPVSGLIDPRKVAAAITPRTRAILPVHLYGQPADMPALQRIARRRGLAVIEDGSQAHGATIQGQPVGQFSDAAGFSCMGGKILATSEAGYLLASKDEVYWRAALMCQHWGRRGEAGFPAELGPHADTLIASYRVSPLIAALFPGQLAKMPAEIEGRRANARAFREAMKGVEWIEFPAHRPGFSSSHHMLTFNYLEERTGVPRAAMLRALQAEGAPVFVYVREPLHRLRRLRWKGYRGPRPFWMEQLRRAKADYGRVSLPACERKVERSVEIVWNFYRPDGRAMQRLAECFHKVGRHLDALRSLQSEEKTR
ncbi:MAG TPA: aminotransferase class I/II-fold pyridoxal phosphate-dependent enzyme [Myxococcaceae bacterium]|nr:aminotransferase class I/II-fold pyridoxal phosphate-dependent enzyme [Myxococcaceae bacterium]